MIKISACVIAKNEAKNITRWAENMQSIADEIIVADTGSEDNTVDLAKAAGATVYHFPWINDFAAAKNFALDKATGNWIVFLDADEYFTADSLPHIRSTIKTVEPHTDIAGIVCRLVNIDEDDNNRFCSAFYQLRIFRHTKKYRYEGKVHEKLTVPKHKKLELAQKVTIYHTGYSGSLAKAKMQRNLSIMNDRIKENGGVVTYNDERYYMDIWYGLGERDKAAAYARKIIARPEADEETVSKAYETLLSVYADGDYPEAEVMSVMEEGKKACPRRSDFVLMQGLYLYKQHDYAAAEKLLQEGLSLHAVSQPVIIEHNTATLTTDDAERLLHVTEWCLGHIAKRKGESQAALEHWVKGLKLFPRHRSMLFDLVALLVQESAPPVDIIELLNGLYDKDKEAAFVADTLAAGQKNSVWLYYAERAGQKISELDRYLAVGRYDAAATVVARQSARYSRLGIWAENHGWADAAQTLNVGLSPRWQKIRRAADKGDAYRRMEREIEELR